MAFEKSVLKSGEPRGDYIKRRLDDGATAREVLDEINTEALYSGPAGKRWDMSVVSAVAKKLDRPSPTIVKAAKLRQKLIAEAAPADSGVLSAAEIAEVREEARRKIDEEKRKAARKDLLARTTAELRAADAAKAAEDPNGEYEHVTIDLAPNQRPAIALDIPYGPQYAHSSTVTVTKQRAATLREIMARGWAHEAEIDGKKKNFYDRSGDRWLAANGAVSGGVRV